MRPVQHILVPVDFSECSIHAWESAKILARQYEASIHLYHHLPIGVQPVVLEEVKRQLQHLAAGAGELQVQTVCEEGALYQTLQQYVHKHGIDLVVMGSHGASGKNEFFIGSNTQKVVRTLHRPVLIVKDKPLSTGLNKVVFASGFNTHDRPAFLQFKALVLPWLPEIHLVAIMTSSLFDAPYVVTKEAMKQFQKLASPLASHLHVYRDFSVEQGIRNLSEELDADLVCISNHFRHPVKRTLVGSNVEALVNHAGMPVLTIDYEE